MFSPHSRAPNRRCDTEECAAAIYESAFSSLIESVSGSEGSRIRLLFVLTTDADGNG